MRQPEAGGMARTTGNSRLMLDGINGPVILAFTIMSPMLPFLFHLVIGNVRIVQACASARRIAQSGAAA